MGFYIRGHGGQRPHKGQLLIHERIRECPPPEGQRAVSASGRERPTTCLRVAIVTVTRTGPPLPGGVHVCQLSSRQPIILPFTGVGVCLMPLLHFPFCAIELRQVADLGSDPHGLTGCEVGCLIVECHRFGVVWYGLIVARNGSETCHPIQGSSTTVGCILCFGTEHHCLKIGNHHLTDAGHPGDGQTFTRSNSMGGTTRKRIFFS